jgi:hypothetical protein
MTSNASGPCAVCHDTFKLRYAAIPSLICSRPTPCQAVICPTCVVGISENHQWKCLYCPESTDEQSEVFACDVAGEALHALHTRKVQVHTKTRNRQKANRLAKNQAKKEAKEAANPPASS